MWRRREGQGRIQRPREINTERWQIDQIDRHKVLQYSGGRREGKRRKGLYVHNKQARRLHTEKTRGCADLLCSTIILILPDSSPYNSPTLPNHTDHDDDNNDNDGIMSYIPPPDQHPIPSPSMFSAPRGYKASQGQAVYGATTPAKTTTLVFDASAIYAYPARPPRRLSLPVVPTGRQKQYLHKAAQQGFPEP